MKKLFSSHFHPRIPSFYSFSIKISALAVLLLSLVACNNSQSGKINPIDTNGKELGVLASVAIGPTTTSSATDGLYSPMAVSLSCDGGADGYCLATYYTIDGTTPNRASTVYSGPISIWSKTTLKYFSIDKAGNAEPVKTQNFLVGSIAIRDIKTFAAGWNHTLGIKKDGTLWAWGGGDSGQLGNGTLVDQKIPVLIDSGSPPWSAVSAGKSFSLGLRSDGTLWAWGLNTNGQLGDGSTIDKKTPVQIGTDTLWQAITAGSSFSLGLKKDGSLWAWGSNSFGQLGDGSQNDKNIPIRIGSKDTWTSISAGYSHSVALMNNGTLWAWGGNSSGQLGDGTKADSNIPVSVPGTNWSAIAAGGSGVPYAVTGGYIVGGHTLALKSDGTLWAWGQDTFGQLGDAASQLNYYMGWAEAGTSPLSEYGGSRDGSLPFQIGSDSDWSNISAGGGHSVALKNDGTLWAWGLNVNGQLANGNAGMNNLLPLPVGDDIRLPLILPKRPWATISAGGYHTTALRSDGTLWAWGWNSSSQLGDNTTMSTGGGSGSATVSKGGFTAISPTWKLPRFAYVVSDKVYPYSIDYNPGSGSGPNTGSGKLTSTAAPVNAGELPTSAAIHPTGKFLYVTDSKTAAVNGDKVSYIHQFSVDPISGALTEIGSDSNGVKTLYDPVSITVDPLGRFVYVVGSHSKGWKTIAVYTVNPASGELTCTGTVAQGAYALAVEPLGRYAYVLKNSGIPSSTGVISYSIDQTTGMLNSAIRGRDELFSKVDNEIVSAKYLTVDLSGQFLYVAKEGGASSSAEIQIYRIIQASGEVVVSGSPYPTTSISAMAISPRSEGEPFAYQYLSMINYSKPNIIRIDQAVGSLTDMNIDLSAASGSVGVAAEATGKLFYYLTSSSIYGYALDRSGKMQPLGSMAGNAGTGGRPLKTMVFASY